MTNIYIYIILYYILYKYNIYTMQEKEVSVYYRFIYIYCTVYVCYNI